MGNYSGLAFIALLNSLHLSAVILDLAHSFDDRLIPAPAIWLSAYQSSSIQYVVRVWTAAGDYWDVYYAIQEGLRESFTRHGIEMTYDHLNVHILER